MRDHVTTIDLRDTAEVLRLREQPITEVLTKAGGPTVAHPGTGVVRPFSLVVLDDAGSLDNHADIYAKLSVPSMSLRTIAVVLSDEEHMVTGQLLPEEMDSNSIAILWVSNPSGIAWVPGSSMADGIGSWPHDPEGEGALESLIDTLGIPEVFTAGFESMATHAASVHTVGLRRWIFSLEAGQSIEDFVHEAGERIAGDRGIDPSRDEPRFWTLPSELTGDAESDSIFVPIEGSVIDLLKKSERRVGALHRLAKEDDVEIVSNSREDLIETAEACGVAFDDLVDRGIELLEQVDPSDGIDHVEHADAKRLGVNLHPGYDAPALLGVSDDMLESVVWDLEQGHSLEPLLGRLASDADAVRVPTQIERVGELQTFKGSKARKRMKNAEERFPESIWVGLLGKDWRALVDWRLAALVGAVVALVGSLMVYLSGRVTEDEGLGFSCLNDTVCDASRGIFGWNGWPTVFMLTLAVLAVSIPVLVFGIRRMAKNARNWIRELGSRQLAKDARLVRERVASIVLNDWVLSGYRNQAETMLSTARGTLEGIRQVVSDRMVGDNVSVDPATAVQRVNPQIEQNLNVEAGAVLYRAFSPIVELIRLDVIALITQSVRSFWPRLQAKSGSQLPEQVTAAVDAQLDQYLRSLNPDTLLDSATGDVDADRRRRAVLEQLWSDQDIVAETIKQTVEAGSSTEMLQMVSLGDLPFLDPSNQASTFVRFAPSLARSQIDDLMASSSDSPSVVLTEHLTSAGALRLVAVRDGVVEFAMGVDRDQSAA